MENCGVNVEKCGKKMEEGGMNLSIYTTTPSYTFRIIRKGNDAYRDLLWFK